MKMDLPLPPAELRERVGCLPPGRDDETGYLEFGWECRRSIERALPDQWTWSGKKVLDFGCGAGRTLRHFADEAIDAQFWGADIDERSVTWNEDNLKPPFEFLQNEERPPLDCPDATFDIVYAVSVFSHLSLLWADWLVELHRVLAPGGLLVATFMGEGLSERIAGKPWDEPSVGMATYQAGLAWDDGGPMVLLSPWWIHEHWGRLFEIENLVPRNFGAGAAVLGPHDHGIVVCRKTDKVASVEVLQRPAARELDALYEEARRLLNEVSVLRPEVTALHKHAGYVDEQFAREIAAITQERDALAEQLTARVPTPQTADLSGRAALRVLAAAVRRRLRP